MNPSSSIIYPTEIESLRQQLADNQKRKVMLRDALEVLEEFADTVAPFSSFWEEVWPKHQEAFAATADLEKVRLCEKEPCAETMSVVTNTGYVYVRAIDRKVEPNTQLYRAWEPERDQLSAKQDQRPAKDG